MATSLSSKKRIRQQERRRLRNKAYRSAMRTEIKKFLVAVAAGDAPLARERYAAVSRRLDKLASKGLIHRNQAARRKSRLAARLRALESPPTAEGAAPAAS